jgi:hypothetical protein
LDIWNIEFLFSYNWRKFHPYAFYHHSYFRCTL